MASTSKVVTPKTRGIWLVGGTLKFIPGNKLPSNQQVLARFFHLHSEGKETIVNSASITAREVLHFWEKARIPTRQVQHVVRKITDLHTKWQGLKKSASRRTETQLMKETAFTDIFGDLFDVAHADAMQLIALEEDREFLLAQREKGRRGSMGPVDTKLAKQEERLLQRKQEYESRKRKEAERRSMESAMVELSHSSTSSENNSSDDECIISQKRQTNKPVTAKPSKYKKTIITPDLAAALDRTKTTDRNAVYVLSATMQSLGQDPGNLTLSRESIRKARRIHREQISEEIRMSFAPNIPLTVHWDGKLLPALMSKEKVDRLAVIVSGEGVMKLLGVPQIPNGTGEAQATAVFNLIQDWQLTDRVQFMCFDTTASNTGCKSGACVSLQGKFKRNLISTACRHHIFELIVGSVFDVLMCASSGPNIKLFERFSNYWKWIDKEVFEDGMKEKYIFSQLNPLKDELISFIQDQMTDFQPRDDYKELLQLSLLFLGGKLREGSSIHAPGALHRARWMAKLIYCLKIYLFRSQFLLTAQEASAIQEFNLFVLKVYLKVWYTAPCPVTSPNSDLDLLKNLVKYKEVNEPVARAAIKSFSGHLWYLSETLVGLAFFDSNVPVEIKRQMVKALERNQHDEPPPRIKIDENQIQAKQLFHFVTSNTRKLFVALDISQEFLNEDPTMWETNDIYISTKQKVLTLKVVNDAAERGVSLIQTFNSVLSNQEEQKQFLLQIVENHRGRFPNANKSTIIQGFGKN